MGGRGEMWYKGSVVWRKDGVMDKKAAVLMADGSEDVEVVAPVDLLRRAGVEVRLLAVGGHGDGGRVVTASHGIQVTCDGAWGPGAADDCDLIVLPGGMRGMERLRGDESVLAAVRNFWSKGKWVASICAGPLTLFAAGVMEGVRFTCYPGCQPKEAAGRWVDEPVVVDGNVVTSQGLGTAIPFGLTLAGLLAGREAMEELSRKVIWRH